MATQDDTFDDGADEGFDETQWTEPAREALLARGKELLAVLQAQIEFYATIEAGTPLVDGWAMAEAVEKAAVVYAEAELDLTGSPGPFGRLSEWDDDDDANDYDDDADADDQTEPAEIVSFISVLQRADYGVVDEQAVLAAGRAAYLEDQPEQSEENAQLYAEHLGAALYQVAHTRGWDALDGLPGLAPLGSVVQVVAPDEQPAPSDDEPTTLFGVSGDVLCAEENRYF